MINYDSPVATNTDLCDELDDKLSNEFEDNIVNVFGRYYAGDIDDATAKQIAHLYNEAKAAYIDAVAALIMYPDAVDYIDFPG